MKQIEVPFYENYCKRCKSLAHCPWRCISGDTCLEMTAFEENKEHESDSEEKKKQAKKKNQN